jgi:uncharacterized protein (TIGR00725 family)
VGASAATAYVAAIGPGESGSSPELEAAAFEVGRELARRGAVLVSGGRGGVMAASCRGARSKGGVTVGLLPGADRAEANEWVSVAIPTGLGELRNGLVARAADAVVAIGGEFGALSEIAFALKAGKRVVGLGTWELARAGEPVDAIEVASDPVDAVARALR